MTFLIQPTSGQIKSAQQATAYFSEVTRRVAAIPGVRSVGAAQHLPLSGFNWRGSLEIESRPIPATASHPNVVWRSVVGDYFGAMRIPLVRGRLFAATDASECAARRRHQRVDGEALLARSRSDRRAHSTR